MEVPEKMGTLPLWSESLRKAQRVQGMWLRNSFLITWKSMVVKAVLAIHQRIQKLTNLGILKGSEYVIDPEKIGYETCAYIGIYLKDPESFDSVTRALEAIPEVVECHFTTGKYDIFIKIYAKNNHHLLSIIHDKLQPLGLARTETLISFHEAIKRQMPIMVDIEDED